MTPLHQVIINKNTKINPIWIMRQAGRYLPEFREIRKLNPDFINLCLNKNLSSEITLQPLKRFDLDAAIIFSDILMLPYGLNQKVEFKKNFGPILGKININEMSKLDEIDFVKKIYPVYKAIKKVSNNDITKNKDVLMHYLRYGKREKRSICKEEMIYHYDKNLCESTEKIKEFNHKKMKWFNILIRTSNRPKYFKKCIASILNQTYNYYHVYICYDKDESLSYLDEYRKNDKITFFK